MAGKPVKIAILTDSRDAVKGFDQAGKAATKASGRLDSVAESSDRVASKGSQAAGALSGLGGLIGGKFGAAMETAGVATQALADSGDLLNVVTESAIVRKVKDTAVTAAQTTATVAKSAADKAATAAQWALNAAMSANPIALVVLALVALVAIFVVAYKHSDKFRAIVDKTFGVLRSVVVGAVTTVVGFVKRNWPLLLAILTGPIGLAVLAITKNWDKIKNGARAVVDSVKSRFGSMLDFFRALPGKLKNLFSNVWSGLAGGLKSAINSVLHLPLKIPRIDTHIPGIGKVGGQTLIPALANGGIVTGPTLALIGEAGPEAVIPLSRGFGVGATINQFNVELNVPVGASAEDIGREFVGYVKAYYDVGGEHL